MLPRHNIHHPLHQLPRHSIHLPLLQLLCRLLQVLLQFIKELSHLFLVHYLDLDLLNLVQFLALVLLRLACSQAMAHFDHYCFQHLELLLAHNSLLVTHLHQTANASSLLHPPDVISLLHPPYASALLLHPDVISLFHPPYASSPLLTPDVISLIHPPYLSSLLLPPDAISLLHPPYASSPLLPPDVISLLHPPYVSSLLLPFDVLSLLLPLSVFSLLLNSYSLTPSIFKLKVPSFSQPHPFFFISLLLFPFFLPQISRVLLFLHSLFEFTSLCFHILIRFFIFWPFLLLPFSALPACALILFIFSPLLTSLPLLQLSGTLPSSFSLSLATFFPPLFQLPLLLPLVVIFILPLLQSLSSLLRICLFLLSFTSLHTFYLFRFSLVFPDIPFFAYLLHHLSFTLRPRTLILFQFDSISFPSAFLPTSDANVIPFSLPS